MMKLELKENMYIRTKDGHIDKILLVEYAEEKRQQYPNHPSKKYWRDKILLLKAGYWRTTQNIIKASYNIIDILEVGDIISFYEDIDNYKKQYVIGIPDLITLDEIKDKITNDNIRLVSILTKQEMEQMAYKVEE